MKKRQVKKLIKRFVFATYYVGEEGILHVNGCHNHDETFMKKYLNYRISEYGGYCDPKEVEELLRRIKR